MQVISDYKKIDKALANSVVAIGNFDGVHVGHRKVIGRAIELAKKSNVSSAILTFEPHPLRILRPDLPPFRLNNKFEKTALVQELGVDIEFEIPFNKEFSELHADKFVQDVIIDGIKASHVVIGHDFIFGYQRSGNAQTLKKLLSKNNIELTQVKPIGDEEVYSSSLVRKLLKDPNLARVKHILGRNHYISGKIIKGDGRGKKLGFATANISLENLLRPAYGVYSVLVEIEGDSKKYEAVANIGNRPTIDGQNEYLEVHIFDFDKDIYNKNVKVELVAFIRSEQQFGSIDALKVQIEQDVKSAKELLNYETQPA